MKELRLRFWRSVDNGLYALWRWAMLQRVAASQARFPGYDEPEGELELDYEYPLSRGD